MPRVIIASANSLLSTRRQAIAWTNADVLSIEHNTNIRLNLNRDTFFSQENAFGIVTRSVFRAQWVKAE